MSFSFTRLSRMILWLLVSVLVLLAVTVTTLRVMLPRLDQHKALIQTWVNDGSGFEFTMTGVHGFWRNTHPSISLRGLTANLPNNQGAHFSVQNVDVEFDLIQSILKLKPVIADLHLNKLYLNIDSISLLPQVNSDTKNTSNNNGSELVAKLDSLLLRQLESFSLLDSTIKYQAFSGESRELNIQHLKWRNNGNKHRAEGVVSIADTTLNSLSVIANFTDYGSLSDVSGQFYTSVNQVSVMPWLTKVMTNSTGISKGNISFNSWLTLEHNAPVDAYVELLPSQLDWQADKKSHTIAINSGFLRLQPNKDGVQVSAHSLKVQGDNKQWPDLDVALDWQPQHWQANLSKLNIERLLPLVTLAPQSKSIQQLLTDINPIGELQDLRLSADGLDLDSLRYSTQLKQAGVNQWKSLPGIKNVNAQISGSTKKAVARLNVLDSHWAMGDMFQAPMNIRQAESHIVWQKQSDGWSLWSDKVTAATPDVQVLGAFRLDVPEKTSPMLSMYAEADVYNASQTWRYLPTLALGQDLTDYLSSAIQGGKARGGKILWYGALDQFPYAKHNGIFQVDLNITDTVFSFDTAWPVVDDMQLGLKFENDAMYLDSHSARLDKVRATRFTGRIPHLEAGSHLEIEATAYGKGSDVRDYMMATPLVDTVGAALTTIQVDGNVEAKFQLNIPFDTAQEVRAWGDVSLKDNNVAIESPPISLSNVSGKISFDNDVVTSKGLQSTWLTQPLQLAFDGKSTDKGYQVNINTNADWKVKPLEPYVGHRWLKRVNGHFPWTLAVNLDLNDVGFNYTINSQAILNSVTSTYPEPLTRHLNESGTMRLQATGNQQGLSARVAMPGFKYQAEIDISKSKPVLTATNLVLGDGGFKISPVIGQHALIRLPKFNLDDWIDILTETQHKPAALDDVNTPEIPLPKRFTLQTKQLTLATLDWHDANITAREQDNDWQLNVKSQEVRGDVKYDQKNNELTAMLRHLHVYSPQIEALLEKSESAKTTSVKAKATPADVVEQISDFDRAFYQHLPNIDATINDFWLQGYKLGDVKAKIKRENNRLNWQNITVSSGKNRVVINGWWQQQNKTSHSKLSLAVKSENNSELMERFGISSGIQKAPFELNSELDWAGAPWSMQVASLNGKVSTKFGKGVISNVNGAARFLGLFSLDSIIRKMQLDFSDIFDKGLAFNSIQGSGEFQDGVFVSNDINMDAIAGEMKIKGLADLNTRLVDAEVQFTPDITSGIPVLTAFAVTPQTALYVLAITTVISPVVEVFTQVNYSVKGPLEAPVVKETSRRKSEYKLPKILRQKAMKE